MSKFLEYFDWICSGIGAAFGWFFGGADGLIVALLAFSCMDYVTGVLAAGMQHRLSSAIGFKGIAKKMVVFVLVGIAHIIDQQFLGKTAVLRNAVILFFCANEGMSILENSDEIGVPIPEKLRELFLQMREKGKEKHKEIDKQASEMATGDE